MIFGVISATAASFLASGLLYALPPVGRLIARGSTPRTGVAPAVQLLSVVARSLLTAILIAALMRAAGWHGVGEGLALGAALGVLPAVLLSGAVVHENTPVPVAATHLLDWVAKLLVTGALVGLFL